MPQDPQTAQVESGLLIAAANLAAGTGQFSISNDPTLQAADVANAMHMKWEMCRSYYAALVGALGDTKDWTPPVLADSAAQGAARAATQAAANQAAVPQPVVTAILQAAQTALQGNPTITLAQALASVLQAANQQPRQPAQPQSAPAATPLPV